MVPLFICFKMLSLISRKRLLGQSQMLHLVVHMNKSSMILIEISCSHVLAVLFCVSACMFFILFADDRYLVSQASIKPLCDLLVCPDPRIVTVCLEGLENILKVGEAEKNLGSTREVNLYAQMIDNAEGLEKIENLQSHDNTEIYEKAVKILETYWLEEEDETMPPGDSSQPGFRFGEVPVPTGGFNFS